MYLIFLFIERFSNNLLENWDCHKYKGENKSIENYIYNIRGMHVMLDSDLTYLFRKI